MNDNLFGLGFKELLIFEELDLQYWEIFELDEAEVGDEEEEGSDDDKVLDTLLHPEDMDDRIHGFCIGHDMDLLEEVYDDKNYV